MRARRTVASFMVLSGAVLASAVYVLYPPEIRSFQFPAGKKFAFTIVDDTDAATVENIRPVYEFLYESGLRTTKTVWVLPTNNADEWANRGDSLRDSAYREFIIDLRDRGFEIASHGARGGSSRRAESLAAMNEFEEIIGYYPKIYINHFENKDDVYFGKDKLTFGLYRWLYSLYPSAVGFEGHIETSEFFWADFLRRHVEYVVNFSFDEVNLLKVNPEMPHHLPEKPYVRYWFHTSDGGVVERFNELLRKGNLDRLEEEGGVSIVYTHLGSGFYVDGQLNATFQQRITDLVSREGWFVTASEILDFLRQQPGHDGELTLREKLRIETIWLWEKVLLGRT